MALSQFYVLSARGDTIISREYRGDVVRGTAETFFRKVKFWPTGDAPPVFNVDGVNYLYVKTHGLYFVTTTKFNVSPSFVLELLNRITKLFKDYCGILTEEALRKNFILVYELLDEVIDYGVAQGTSTEVLKDYVRTEPVEVVTVSTTDKLKQAAAPAMSSMKTTPSSAVHKPITAGGGGGRGGRNEIFVDILERLTVTFNSSGYVMNGVIDGCIQMKSYLSGNPPLVVALNEDLAIGTADSRSVSCVLDDCNFHECADLSAFESSRTMRLNPPDGEFVLMNYRVTSEFRPPFRVIPLVEEVAPERLEVLVKVRADMPADKHGSHVTARFRVPPSAATVTPQLPIGATGQAAEYNEKKGEVAWQLRKVQGGEEHTLRTVITLSKPAGPGVRRQLGPIALTFELPMFNASNLLVKYLRIAEGSKSYKPYRWVRYVTRAGSYTCRL